VTTAAETAPRPLMPILVALSGAHLLNDLIQSMIPAMYPLFKESYALSFAQIGLITLAFQVASSLLQPVLGYGADQSQPSKNESQQPARSISDRTTVLLLSHRLFFDGAGFQCQRQE
jgi:hypothetical protein